jgi:hypothetical protein
MLLRVLLVFLSISTISSKLVDYIQAKFSRYSKVFCLFNTKDINVNVKTNESAFKEVFCGFKTRYKVKKNKYKI